MPKRDIVLYAIERTGFSRLQVGAINGHAIMMLNLLMSTFILFWNVRVGHSSIRQTGDNRDAMPSFNKFLTYIRSVKGLRPIVLANDKYLH